MTTSTKTRDFQNEYKNFCAWMFKSDPIMGTEPACMPMSFDMWLKATLEDEANGEKVAFWSIEH